MITNISVLSPSSVRISVGQYNHSTQVLDLWVYATRYITEGDTKFTLIPEFEMDICKQAKKVRLVDQDCGYHYEMTMSQFKRIPVKDGSRKVNISKLKTI